MNHAAMLRKATTKAKIVEDPLLNIMGLQVARTVAARIRYWQRRFRPEPEVRLWAAEAQLNGFVVIPRFITGTDLTNVTVVARNLLDMQPQTSEPTTKVQLSYDSPHLDGALGLFFRHAQLWALVSGIDRRPVQVGDGVMTVERLVQRPDQRDPQVDLHSDTFFNTIKCWLYLTDVDLAAGPLCYVSQSHKLSPRQLLGVYQHSLNPGGDFSRRIGDREHEARRLSEERTLVCEKGALVVANTFGYHRRLEGTPPAVREALHIQVRANPFRRRPSS